MLLLFAISIRLGALGRRRVSRNRKVRPLIVHLVVQELALNKGEIIESGLVVRIAESIFQIWQKLRESFRDYLAKMGRIN